MFNEDSLQVKSKVFFQAIERIKEVQVTVDRTNTEFVSANLCIPHSLTVFTGVSVPYS